MKAYSDSWDYEDILKGGSGSGNFGHGGRQGEVGGSSYEGGRGERPTRGDLVWHDGMEGRIDDINGDNMTVRYNTIATTRANMSKPETKTHHISDFNARGSYGTGRKAWFVKGGSGSGNFGHSGRQGEVGGSSSEGSGTEEGGSGVSGKMNGSVLQRISGVKFERNPSQRDYKGIGLISGAMSFKDADKAFSKLTSHFKPGSWHSGSKNKDSMTFQNRATGDSIEISRIYFSGDYYVEADLGYNYLRGK
jgi:hypothetical protein